MESRVCLRPEVSLNTEEELSSLKLQFGAGSQL